MDLLLRLLLGLIFSSVFIGTSSIVGNWLASLGVVQDTEDRTRWIMGIVIGLILAWLPTVEEGGATRALPWSTLAVMNGGVALLFAVAYYWKNDGWKAVKLGRWWWLESPEEIERRRVKNRRRYYGSLMLFGLFWLGFILVFVLFGK